MVLVIFGRLASVGVVLPRFLAYLCGIFPEKVFEKILSLSGLVFFGSFSPP